MPSRWLYSFIFITDKKVRGFITTVSVGKVREQPSTRQCGESLPAVWGKLGKPPIYSAILPISVFYAIRRWAEVRIAWCSSLANAGRICHAVDEIGFGYVLPLVRELLSFPLFSELQKQRVLTIQVEGAGRKLPLREMIFVWGIVVDCRLRRSWR